MSAAKEEELHCYIFGGEKSFKQSRDFVHLTCTCIDRSRGLQEVEAPRFFRQSAHEDGKIVSPKHRSLLPPGDIPNNHFCSRLI
jgi:hypothetical protein